MDNAGYAALSRMSGLAAELKIVANNLANMGTAGFRAERAVFAESLRPIDGPGGALAMARPAAHWTDFEPGGARATGGELDIAIDGPGFLTVEAADGPRLTRAGAFRIGPEGAIVDAGGRALLGEGGAPIAPPAGTSEITVAADGTISADGVPIDRIAIADAAPEALVREAGALFRAVGPTAPAEGARLLSGFVEDSNVEPVAELARMIEVQRAYELGQAMLDLDDERLREAVRSLGRVS